MSLTVRRVVTGHDNSGRAKVLIDEIAKNVVQGRPGAHAAVIWTTEGFPVSNDGDADASGRKVGTTLDGGTVFRVVSFGPGVTPRNHRTDSIDYAVVISGEIDMELDDGQSVHLEGRRRAGAARHHPQLGQQGHGALRHRLRAGCRQAGQRRRQGAQRRRRHSREKSGLILRGHAAKTGSASDRNPQRAANVLSAGGRIRLYPAHVPQATLPRRPRPHRARPVRHRARSRSAPSSSSTKAASSPTPQAAKLEARGNRYLYEINSRWTIDGTTRRNLGRYANHSCRPNAEAHQDRAQSHRARHQDDQAGRRDHLRLRRGLLPQRDHAVGLQMRQMPREAQRRRPRPPARQGARRQAVGESARRQTLGQGAERQTFGARARQAVGTSASSQAIGKGAGRTRRDSRDGRPMAEETQMRRAA